MHCIKYRGNIQSSLILRKEPLIVRCTFDFITVWSWIYSMYVRECSLNFAVGSRAQFPSLKFGCSTDRLFGPGQMP